MQGYLVKLGDGVLSASDSIIGPTTGFNSSSTLGSGSWTWSGVREDDGLTYSDVTDTGTYHLGTDGNVYFVPTTYQVSDVTTASATTAPSYDGATYGTSGNNTISGDGSDNAIYGGSSTSESGTGRDNIDGGGGDDLIVGGDGRDRLIGGGDNDTISGGEGNDTIYGDAATTPTTSDEHLSWITEGSDGTSIVNGFTQDTGSMRVTVNFNNDGGNTYVQSSSATQWADTGEPFDTASAVKFGGGSGPNATTSIVFDAEAGTGFSDAVSDVSFRINDVDSGAWQDVITINAYDLDGNPIPVVLTASGNDTVSGQTVTSGSGGNSSYTQGGSVLVEIAGPVHMIEVVYSNGSSGSQVLWLTDVHYTTVVPAPGDDTIDGGTGDDTIYAGAGDDTVTGGTGNDSIRGGAGDDTLRGDAGTDTLYGETGSDRFIVDDNDGTTTIAGGEDAGNTDYDTVQLDEAGSGSGVNVTFTGDEAGTFTFNSATSSGSFTEIERIEATDFDDVIDVTASNADQTIEANAGDDTVLGGGGDDLISGGDGSDSLTGGGGADAMSGGDGGDSIDGGAGSDTIDGGGGNDSLLAGQGDTAYGSDGDDTFTITDSGDGPGVITIVGGEGGEGAGDTLNLNSLAQAGTLNITTPANVGGGMSGSVTLLDGTIVNFSEIESIICFTPGTLITTPMGLRAVEKLQPGDLVVTRDHGLQPIRWAQSRTVRGDGRLAPIRIKSNTFTGQERDLLVSPQHRMLYRGYRAELLFSESEVLVAATHMVNGDSVAYDPCDQITYVHIMFDQHEVIFAEGAATESFHPGDMALNVITARAREELFTIFPSLRAMPRSFGATARRTLRGHEGNLLLAG